jgi:hypothetical protein
MRAVVLAGCITAAAVLAACDAQAPATTTTAHPATSTTPPLTSVTPAAIPPEPPGEPTREASSPDPSFDYGFVIDITPGGFHPNWLIAGCCRPITWINLTSKPNTVVFTVELTHSPPIPPGGSWTFTPLHAESITYQSETFPSMTGAVQVNQTSD